MGRTSALTVLLRGRATVRRRVDPRRAKIHLSYSVDEAARALGVHRNTVREWLRRGLPTCDSKRPTMIRGRDLRDFLNARARKNKRPCRPGEFYCVRCRAPRAPDGALAEYQPMTAQLGCLVGICSTCNTVMNRRVSLAKMHQARGTLEILMPVARRHIDESQPPTANSEFERYAEDDQDTQRRQ